MITRNRRTFVLGDIHGRHDRLMEVLRLCEFDYKNDILIQLGDVCDRGRDTYKVVEELLKISNLIKIRGNHDAWFYDFIRTGVSDSGWLHHGGNLTINSYMGNLNTDGFIKYIGLLPEHMPETHKEFFKSQIPYYVDDQNRMFVHGGFNRHDLVSEVPKEQEHIFWWDRDLFMSALSHKDVGREFKTKDDFKEIYIGHTPTIMWKKQEPMFAANNRIINIDTGAGYSEGKLTIMDIDTKEYFQSTL